jgi:hypothetical protein
MKSEDQVKSNVGVQSVQVQNLQVQSQVQEELTPPPFSASALATTGGHAEETMKLRTENNRLQRLVAELLIENQQLRQRYCGSRIHRSSATPQADHREN